MSLNDAINLKTLSNNIFSDIAEEAAKHITTNTNQNKASQIRKYYDELAMWD